jgi:hypothetical protein
MLAELYAMLYARIPQPVTEAGLSEEFSDKELRVLMKHNGMLINDYDQRSGRYNEKPKTLKCKILVAAMPTLIVPGTETDADSPTSAGRTHRRNSRKAEWGSSRKPCAQARGSSSSSSSSSSTSTSSSDSGIGSSNGDRSGGTGRGGEKRPRSSQAVRSASANSASTRKQVSSTAGPHAGGRPEQPQAKPRRSSTSRYRRTWLGRPATDSPPGKKTAPKLRQQTSTRVQSAVKVYLPTPLSGPEEAIVDGLGPVEATVAQLVVAVENVARQEVKQRERAKERQRKLEAQHHREIGWVVSRLIRDVENHWHAKIREKHSVALQREKAVHAQVSLYSLAMR